MGKTRLIWNITMIIRNFHYKNKIEDKKVTQEETRKKKQIMVFHVKPTNIRCGNFIWIMNTDNIFSHSHEHFEISSNVKPGKVNGYLIKINGQETKKDPLATENIIPQLFPHLCVMKRTYDTRISTQYAQYAHNVFHEHGYLEDNGASNQ